jgi:hypothetical protein
MDHFKFSIAETDLISSREKTARLRGMFHVQPEHPGMVDRPFTVIKIIAMANGPETVFLQHQYVAENMIQMAVGVQKQNRLQSLPFKQSGKFPEFIIVVAAAIDNSTFARVVRKHKGVYRYRIENQSGYFHHIITFFY